MSEDAVFVQGTIVTRETVQTSFGMQDLIFLHNEDAPEDMREVVAGRVLHGTFQFAPMAPFTVSPQVLRKIADLIEVVAQ